MDFLQLRIKSVAGATETVTNPQSLRGGGKFTGGLSEN